MIEKDDVKHIAKLARIGISPKEKEVLKKELSSVLDYMKVLNDADVSDIEPTFHPSEAFFKGKNIVRDDTAEEKGQETADKIVAGFPRKRDRHIKVKSIF